MSIKNNNILSQYKVVKFSQDTFNIHKSEIMELTKHTTKEIFYAITQQLLVTYNEDIFYLMDLDKVVGFCMFCITRQNRNSMTNIYIKQIFILPEYRGKGLSILLIKAIIKEAVLLSNDFITVDFIDINYGNNIGKKIGFKNIGTHPNYKIANKIHYFHKFMLLINNKICNKYKKYDIETI